MKKYFTWVDAVTIILFLLSVYFVLTRIFGHSATDITIAIGLFTILSGFLYKLWASLYSLNREFGEFKIHAINSFDNVKRDMNELKVKVDKIDSKLEESMKITNKKLDRLLVKKYKN